MAQFKLQFPEFARGANGPTDANDALLQAMLDAAEVEIDRTVWGAKGDQGQMLLAAHKLATSPWGQNAKLVDAKGSTTYWGNYTRLMHMVATGPRVVTGGILPWPYFQPGPWPY